MVTGRVFEIPAEKFSYAKGCTTFTDLPMWDSPVLISDLINVPLRVEWAKTSPCGIIDLFYRPGQPTVKSKALPPERSEPWMQMKTEDFLPCIDKYGQFRHRDWPGKTKSDEDLKRAAAEEEKDLAAHPGPADRNRYGV